MLKMSTKQLMDQSKGFTFLFWGAIVVFSVAIILNIIWPFTSCYWCSGYWPISCVSSGGTHYCCTSSYGYCASSGCYVSYNDGPCIGVIITAGCLYIIAFFMAIAVFIMFRNLR